MKTRQVLLWLLLLAQLGASAAQIPPNFLWAQLLCSSGAFKFTSLAVDDEHNSYLSGYLCRSNAEIGGVLFTNAGSILVKRDGAGNIAWAVSVEDSSASGHALAADRFGNVYLASQASRAQAQTNGGSGEAASSSSSGDYVLAKYDSRGKVLWARSTGSAEVQSADLAVDPVGNCYWAFLVRKPTTIEDLNVTNGAVVVKFNPDGNALWARGNVGAPNHPKITADPVGNVFLAGDFSAKIRFGNTNLESTLSREGISQDIYVAKYCNCGQLLWVTQSKGTEAEYLQSIAVDGAGSLLLVGGYQGQLPFGNTILEGNATNECLFAAKYHPNGSVLWTQRIDEQSRLGVTLIAADIAGNSYVASCYTDAPISISKRNGAGQPIWKKQCLGVNKPLFKVDGAGRSYVAADFSAATVTLDKFTLTNEAEPENKSNSFLAVLDAVPSESLLQTQRPAGSGVYYAGSLFGFRPPASPIRDDVLTQNDEFSTMVFPVSAGRMLFELKPR